MQARLKPDVLRADGAVRAGGELRGDLWCTGLDLGLAAHHRGNQNIGLWFISQRQPRDQGSGLFSVSPFVFFFFIARASPPVLRAPLTDLQLMEISRSQAS